MLLLLALVAPEFNNVLASVFPCLRVTAAAAVATAPPSAVIAVPSRRGFVMYAVVLLLLDVMTTLVLYGALGYWYVSTPTFVEYVADTAWGPASWIGNSYLSANFPEEHAMIVTVVVAASIDVLVFIGLVVIEVRAFMFVWDLRKRPLGAHSVAAPAYFTRLRADVSAVFAFLLIAAVVGGAGITTFVDHYAATNLGIAPFLVPGPGLGCTCTAVVFAFVALIMLCVVSGGGCCCCARPLPPTVGREVPVTAANKPPDTVEMWQAQQLPPQFQTNPYLYPPGQPYLYYFHQSAQGFPLAPHQQLTHSQLPMAPAPPQFQLAPPLPQSQSQLAPPLPQFHPAAPQLNERPRA